LKRAGLMLWARDGLFGPSDGILGEQDPFMLHRVRFGPGENLVRKLLFCFRSRSFRPSRAWKPSFPAEKIRPVKKMVRAMKYCSVGPDPVKITVITGHFSSPTARKQSCTSTHWKKASRASTRLLLAARARERRRLT
jgi:hypothetical protein